jgi:hypothetical protein
MPKSITRISAIVPYCETPTASSHNNPCVYPGLELSTPTGVRRSTLLSSPSSSCSGSEEEKKRNSLTASSVDSVRVARNLVRRDDRIDTGET